MYSFSYLEPVCCSMSSSNCCFLTCTIGFSRGRSGYIEICNKEQVLWSSRKTSTSASLTTLKPLTVWITTNWKILREMGVPYETSMWAKKQHLESNMKQQTCSKLGKEYNKAVYCHPAYLTYMQNTSREILGLMKHKLESRLPGEISITSDMQMTPPLWQKVKRN